jgi:hypothetical protein
MAAGLGLLWTAFVERSASSWASTPESVRAKRAASSSQLGVPLQVPAHERSPPSGIHCESLDQSHETRGAASITHRRNSSTPDCAMAAHAILPYFAMGLSSLGDSLVEDCDNTASMEPLGSHARCRKRSGGSTNNSNSRVLTGWFIPLTDRSSFLFALRNLF